MKEEKYDDLAELRELLARTKGNLKGYGKDLYKFRNSCNQANTQANRMGKGWSERNFSNMEKCFRYEHKTNKKYKPKVQTGAKRTKISRSVLSNIPK